LTAAAIRCVSRGTAEARCADTGNFGLEKFRLFAPWAGLQRPRIVAIRVNWLRTLPLPFRTYPAHLVFDRHRLLKRPSRSALKGRRARAREASCADFRSWCLGL
jgi:hypothetical protein